jgi:hypothetical protein
MNELKKMCTRKTNTSNTIFTFFVFNFPRSPLSPHNIIITATVDVPVTKSLAKPMSNQSIPILSRPCVKVGIKSFPNQHNIIIAATTSFFTDLLYRIGPTDHLLTRSKLNLWVRNRKAEFGARKEVGPILQRKSVQKLVATMMILCWLGKDLIPTFTQGLERIGIDWFDIGFSYSPVKLRFGDWGYQLL